MKSKWAMLKKYLDLQSDDYDLWFDTEYSTESYLQQELRRLAWMIEDATVEQIKDEINKYKERLWMSAPTRNSWSKNN